MSLLAVAVGTRSKIRGPRSSLPPVVDEHGLRRGRGSGRRGNGRSEQRERAARPSQVVVRQREQQGWSQSAATREAQSRRPAAPTVLEWLARDRAALLEVRCTTVTAPVLRSTPPPRSDVEGARGAGGADRRRTTLVNQSWLFCTVTVHVAFAHAAGFVILKLR